MPLHDRLRIGYVVKRYPRFSETFIVNEVLAHEAAGFPIEIFSLQPPVDTHFQNAISRVQAPVTYLAPASLKAAALWEAMEQTQAIFSGFWPALHEARGERVADLLQGMMLARLVAERGIDHLHAHFATSAATVVRLASRFCGVTYSFTAHAKDIFHESVRTEDFARKLHDASAVVTVSDFNLSHLKETFSSCGGDVCRVYNGLDLAEFTFTDPEARPPRIVSVGRLIEKKGFHVLVEACALLRRKRKDFRCVIIGTGALHEQLRMQIDRLNLNDCVEMAGARPLADVMQSIRNSAALAAPCVVGNDGDRDGLPTVLLEAMALGTPCVATDVTGIPEVIRHEQTGLLVRQNDAGQLAAALERLLDDAALRRRLAVNARSLIEVHFDIHRNAAQLRELFARSAAARHPAESTPLRSPSAAVATSPDALEGYPAAAQASSAAVLQ